MSPDEYVPRRNGRGCENWDPLPFLSGATTQHARFMPRPASIVADIMDGMAASKQGRGGAASNGRMEWRRHPASDLCRWYKRRTECLNISLLVHCISCHLWTLDTPKTLIAALSQSSPCLLHFPLVCVIAQTAEAGTGSGQQAQMNTCNWRS